MPSTRPDRAATGQIGELLSVAEVERLRAAGYAVVPLRPSEEMVKVGAPLCYKPAEAQNDQTWKTALSDAGDCYRAMVDLGCL